ncbi:amino acid adenylation domain-containing protein [Saccharothrix sp. BKS2]|uniref:amino acid adenylation domain-containing protein n=1 Tax=Saccharothrix sp. BKS2 TaxID=3064400 RepID=UPI0039EA4059
MTADQGAATGVYVFPASRAQYQMFFVQQVVGDAPTYHVPLCYRLSGEVDEGALRRAVADVVARHEALRTRFALADGELLQVVDPTAEPELTVAHAVPADGWVAREAARPFDLERGPLFRAALLRLGGAESVLVLTMHHIVCDGWSADLVFGEVVEGYAAHVAGRDPDLPAPAFQYADYSGWQDEWLAGPAAAAQLAHWREVLAHPLTTLELPTGGPGGPPAGADLSFDLPADAVARLRALAAESGATLFMVLLAAFKVLLRELSGVDDVVVGTVSANRGRPEFAGTVGFLVNTLAVRTRLDGAPTFRDVLHRVRGNALAAFANQDVPFELVVEEVKPPRAGDRHPVFQVLFTFFEAGDGTRTAADVGFTPFLLDSGTAKFPLTLEITDRDRGAGANFEYRSDLFGAEQVGRFAERYARLLEDVAADPDRPLDANRPPDPDRPPDAVRARPVAAEDDWDEPAPYAAPTNAVEAVLAGIWSQVLGRDPVGIDDNYFEIGGDSIRSVQLLARAREHGLGIKVTDLVLHQTIRELAPRTTPAEPGQTAEVGRLELLAPADRELIGDDVVDAYPLSALQAGMLYHSESSDSEQIYHNVATYHLRVEHSETAWREAVATAVARHEVLRTSFAVAGFGEPVQLVHARVPTPLTFEDLRDEADVEAAVARRFRAERARPFDWTRPPLIRFHVQRRADDEVQLWIVEHHAIVDGWSGRSLFAELLTLYVRALGHDREVPPPPKARFRTFVALERAALADDAQRAFWTDLLHDVTAGALPLGGPATAEPDMAMTEFTVPAEVGAGLLALANRLRVSVRVVLLAAHLRVVSLLSGRDDVVTGVVYNGRGEETDGDRVLGLFLNTVPFRLELPDGTWADLVRHVSDADVAIQPHRRFPLAELQRAHGGEPLFETFFNYTHFHVSRDQPSGDVLELVDEDSVVPTNFPFGAEFFRDAGTGEIAIGLRHDRTRLDTGQVERARDYYLAALRALVTDPDATHTDAELRPERERALLAGWNDTDRHYPGPHLLHALTDGDPDAPAVRFGDTVLTYREFDARANRLAHRLIELGVRPGTFVGVSAERSVELVVALHAVVRAGGAYLPLDPDNPPARTEEMVAQARPVVVLADRDLPGAHRLDLATAYPDTATGHPDTATAHPDTAPVTAVTPDDPAYLIFTSGSTGRPKGVVVPHRAIANRLLWMQDEYPIGPDDRVLQKTPYSFDVSVWEFFWPLMTGACLVVARPGGHRDPAYLTGLVREAGVTVLHFVPSMLRAFLDDDDVPACTSLRRVFASGEALPHDLQQRFFATHPAELVNLYGPTEAAVDVSHWRCRDDGRAVVPIGRPIANVRLHVLDARRRPVPIGVAGELHIGGVGLADGYVGRPDLTAERFAGGLYRTGDLARHLPGGELEYLGRVDDQVKVRGFRVEPAEVEAVLGGHDGVRGCAVVVRDGALAAFFAGDADPARLRAFLLDRLPEHMVPRLWRAVDAIPLSANGKVDRRALAAVEVRRDRTSAAEPVTEAERVLLDVWRDVLGIEDVGVLDTFGELGGHSLKALRLLTAVRKRFGRAVPVNGLLDGGTVRSVAALLTGNDAAVEDRPRLRVLRAGGDGTPVVLVHPAGGALSVYRALVAAIDPRHPVHGVSAAARPAADVGETAAAYLGLLRGFPRHHLAGWSFGAVVAHEMAVRAPDRTASLTMVDPSYPGQYDVDDVDFAEQLRHELGDGPAGDAAALLAVFEANARAHARHRPGVYGGDAVFVQGEENREHDSAGRWAAHVAGRFTAHDLPADHFALVRPPHAAAVAALIDLGAGSDPGPNRGGGT